MNQQKHMKEYQKKKNKQNLRQYKQNYQILGFKFKASNSRMISSQIKTIASNENISIYSNKFKPINRNSNQVCLNGGNDTIKQNDEKQQDQQNFSNISISKQKSNQNNFDRGGKCSEISQKTNCSNNYEGKFQLKCISKSLFNINTFKLPSNFFYIKKNKQKTQADIPTDKQRKRISSMQNLRKRVQLSKQKINIKKQNKEFTFQANLSNSKYYKVKNYTQQSDDMCKKKHLNEQAKFKQVLYLSQKKKMIDKNLKYIHKLKESFHYLKL